MTWLKIALVRNQLLSSLLTWLSITHLLFVSYFKILKHKKQTNTAFYIHLCSYWVCVYHINMFFFVQYYLNKVTAKKINNGRLKSTQNLWLFSVQQETATWIFVKNKKMKTKIKQHSKLLQRIENFMCKHAALRSVNKDLNLKIYLSDLWDSPLWAISDCKYLIILNLKATKI